MKTLQIIWLYIHWWLLRAIADFFVTLTRQTGNELLCMTGRPLPRT